MSSKQISFRVPPRLLAKFNQQMESVFIPRSRFLDHMLALEIPRLDSELGTRKLSLRAKRHISGALKRNGAKSVNIEVDSKTAAALVAVVKKHNLARDAFISRLMLFLISSDALLKYLEIPLEVGDRRLGPGLPGMPVSPLKAFSEVLFDPLFYVRECLLAQDSGPYLVGLPSHYDWAACFIDDADIPGTKKHREAMKYLV